MRLTRLGRLVLVTATVGALGVAAAAVARSAFAGGPVTAPDPALTRALDALLTEPGLAGSTYGLVVRTATGEVMYSRNPDVRVIPASNEKLMTAAAALEVLRPGYRFHTRVFSTGGRSGGTLKGDLYLKGYGDPTLTQAAYDSLATSVAAAGITSVTGRLVADDSWFDRTRLGLDWSWTDEVTSDEAPVSALTVAATDYFDIGSVRVDVRPGARLGDLAKVTVVPAGSGMTVVNRTATGAAGNGSTISAQRGHGSRTITVTGSLGAGHGAVSTLVPVVDPTASAAGAFRAALQRHGVKVHGSTGYAVVPGGARTVVDRSSATLGTLLKPFLKLSNNGIAEVLVKAMGRAKGKSGTWADGLAVERAALADQLGVRTSATVLAINDGSGLTRRDLLSTEEIDRLLVAAQNRSWFPTWYGALPVAGMAGPLVGGTLTGRMRTGRARNNLHGKTGTLTAVNALSGYVTDAHGERLVFSAVINNNLVYEAGLLDRIGDTLADHGASAAALQRRATAPIAPQRPPTRNGEWVECSWIDAC
jgi:serine-type D-Ala-D-Ala carboxypeptidase/endopeptidase (penicillin-binding protein 4)